MSTTTRIFVTTRFASFHQWENAPEEVGFLRYPHRHLFHVRAEWEVTHDDRDLEFFIQKGKLEEFIRAEANEWPLGVSCEMMAEKILTALGCTRVEVSEDGENGSIVERGSEAPPASRLIL